LSASTDRIYSIGAIRFVLWLRVAIGLALFILTSSPALLACFTAIIITSIYLTRRVVFGGDGSDQMGLVVSLGALLIALGLSINDIYIGYSGVTAIAGQAVISYFAAGAAKAASPIWRCGDAIIGVMRTQTYGHPLAARIAENKVAVRKAVCWTVIITEMLFPVILVLPTELAIAALCGFAFFHLINAIFMGLNTFVPTFLATYPAVMLANQIIRSVFW
jgi:hypothetical protein